MIPNHLGPEHLNRQEVLQAIFELKKLRKFKDKELEDLVDPACDLILSIIDRIPAAERLYKARKNQLVSPVDAARIVTGLSVPSRAKTRFKLFCKFLSQPNALVKNWDRERIYRHLELGANSGYTKQLCDQLKPICSNWWKSDDRKKKFKKAP